MNWSEESIFKLMTNIHHSLFHEERKRRVEKQHRTINAALIRVFAYRLAYQNFNTLKQRFAEVADEIASQEIKQELINLEAEEYSDNDACNLLKIMIQLLREEIEKSLGEDGEFELHLDEDEGMDTTETEETDDFDVSLEALSETDISLTSENEPLPESVQKEDKKEDKTACEWAVSSSGGALLKFKGETLEQFSKSLAEYRQKKVTTSTDRIKERESKTTLSNQAKADKKPKKSDDKKPVIQESVAKSMNDDLDFLARRLGDAGLDELIYGKKSKKKVEDDIPDDDDDWMGWVD
jgi:hypothetical protein